MYRNPEYQIVDVANNEVVGYVRLSEKAFDAYLHATYNTKGHIGVYDLILRCPQARFLRQTDKTTVVYIV